MTMETFHKDGPIYVFHQEPPGDHIDYPVEGLDNLYAAEERHFWFLTRKAFIAYNMNLMIPKDSKIIEIGAGTGNVTKHLIQAGYTNIAVGEMHASGLHYAHSYGITRLYQFDLLRAPFETEFDAVCLFDVLEHIEEEETALSNTRRMLKPEGKIVLTVPAHQWLWSREDVIAGHKRRYTRHELHTKLEQAGFEIIKSKYFFVSITPLLLLRRILNKATDQPVTKAELNTEITIHPIINAILLHLCRLENRLLRFLPSFFGGSLMIVAKRIDAS